MDGTNPSLPRIDIENDPLKSWQDITISKFPIFLCNVLRVLDMSPVHPYYPLGLVIPNWLPQTVAMEKILFRFFVTLTVLFIGFALVYRRRPESKTTFSSPPFFLAAWFFLCGVIHTFVEGYFVATHATIAGDDTFLANLWKEYGKSDSRYMVSDPTVLLIEAITAVRSLLC